MNQGVRARLALVGAMVVAFSCAWVASIPAAAATVPRFSHVMEVFLENESSSHTWDDATAAPYLQSLRKTYSFIPNFFGAGHASLDNYEAAWGAVEPTTQGKADCGGMPYSTCIFPASVPTIAKPVEAAGLTWKVYSEGEDGAPGGHDCLHAPSRQGPDPYQGYGVNGYATRHNPAPWFDSILSQGGSEAYCQAHAVDLTNLDKDLASPASLPNLTFIEPDTCHDGHDDQSGSSNGCTLDPEGPTYPSGVGAIEKWLPDFVKKVTTSAAWDSNSLLFITFDEGDATDTSGCAPCGDTSAGGKIGAVALGTLVRPAFTSTWQGDHYGFLRTIEASWGLPTLKSMAADQGAAKTVHDGDPNVTPLTDVWASGVSASQVVQPLGGVLPNTGLPVLPAGVGLVLLLLGLFLGPARDLLHHRSVR